jgi:hypothetical protein
VSTTVALDANHTFYLYPNKTCAGDPMLIYQPTQLGSRTETFEPGFPVKGGAGISGRWLATNTYAVVQVYGYSVPATAVP